MPLVSLSNAALEGGAGSSRLRLPAIDAARGLAVAAMVVYHFAWDLSELRFVATEVTAEPGWRLFARAIAASFLLLSGIGLALAHSGGIRWRAFLRRLATVAGAALLITVATLFAFPQSYIFFGILHAIAVSSVLALPLTPAPAWVPAVLAILVAAAPLFLSGGVFDLPPLAFLGLASREPITNDWVPLFPWAAFVFAGVAIGKTRLLQRVGAPQVDATSAGRVLSWAGRHSLVIYLLHQPILFGALYGLLQLTGPNLAAVATRVERSCPVSYVQAGIPEDRARKTCSCTVDGMKEAGIWTDFLRERLSDEQGREVTRIARACLERNPPSD